jgi:hypothetical protein
MAEPAEKVRIFISSVQNKEIEDLDSERAEVIKTVKDYSPIYHGHLSTPQPLTYQLKIITFVQSIIATCIY